MFVFALTYSFEGRTGMAVQNRCGLSLFISESVLTVEAEALTVTFST